MKKIMFNDSYGLTRAVIEGRKTMTRRLCKDNATGEVILAREVEKWRYFPKENQVLFLMKNGDIKISTPQYTVGEEVAVAQNYEDALEEYNRMGDTVGWGALVGSTENGCAGYYNKMFVKAELMPHRVNMEAMKIEPVKGITEEECMKEGIMVHDGMPAMADLYVFPGRTPVENYLTPREAFAALFEKRGVGGPGMWEKNPFVVAYEYRLER
jgi:hypothetical protein